VSTLLSDKDKVDLRDMALTSNRLYGLPVLFLARAEDRYILCVFCVFYFFVFIALSPEYVS